MLILANPRGGWSQSSEGDNAGPTLGRLDSFGAFLDSGIDSGFAGLFFWTVYGGFWTASTSFWTVSTVFWTEFGTFWTVLSPARFSGQFMADSGQRAPLSGQLLLFSGQFLVLFGQCLHPLVFLDILWRILDSEPFFGSAPKILELNLRKESLSLVLPPIS